MDGFIAILVLYVASILGYPHLLMMDTRAASIDNRIRGGNDGG